VLLVRWQFSEEVRVESGVPQGSALGPLLSLALVNNIQKNTEATIRLSADDCIMYRNILSNNGVKKLQIDLNRLGEWAFESDKIINPAKDKSVCFMTARAMESLNYS
jgi:hypothetical protein